MPFIITDPCIETKDTACVDVCPVDCIHPRKDEAEFAQATMLYIHPEECIDCGACVPACPVAAIYESIDATPSHQKDLIEANAVYRIGDADAMAKAEEIVQGARRVACRHHGHPRGGTSGGARPVLTRRAQREDRNLERQRHPGAVRAGPGMDRARAPGRRLPAGNQGRRPTSCPSGSVRDAGLLVLLARRQGLLRRRPPHQPGGRSRAAALLPSRLRLREPHRFSRRRRRDRRLGLRAERRQGLPRQDALPRSDGRVRAHLSGCRQAAGDVRRPERRAHRPRRAPEGTQAAGDRPAPGGAGS